jgi:peptidyl-prolyl cis-trans isomerase A (cyclophilin A)
MALDRRDFLLGAAAAAATPTNPRVRLLTPLGGITLLVRLDRAPRSAADFLKYVQNGDYNGGRFFRTVRPGNDHGHPPINVVQGGTNPAAKVGLPVPHETTAMTGLRHLAGTISLTRDAPGTGSGAEFFICVEDTPGLDFGGHRNSDGQGFAAFGNLTAGMEVLRKIWKEPAEGHSDDSYTIGQILTHPVPILKARVL